MKRNKLKICLWTFSGLVALTALFFLGISKSWSANDVERPFSKIITNEGSSPLVERVGVMEERLDPAVRLLELKRNSPDVLIGHITSYEFRELGERKRHPYHQFVIYYVKPEKHLKGTTAEEIQIWVGGVQGPAGPVLVSETPQPEVGEKAILFLKYESTLGTEAYIPASDEWSYLPIHEKTNVVLPTGGTFNLGEVTNMIERDLVP